MPCFISSRGPFGSVYLYLKGSTSPTDVSLPLRPDLGIYSMWNSLLIYLCGPRPLHVSFYFFTFLILVLFISKLHQYNPLTCTQLSRHSSPKMKILHHVIPNLYVVVFHETTGEWMDGWIPCSELKVAPPGPQLEISCKSKHLSTDLQRQTVADLIVSYQIECNNFIWAVECVSKNYLSIK